jgi:hypothetical protein
MPAENALHAGRVITGPPFHSAVLAAGDRPSAIGE